MMGNIADTLKAKGELKNTVIIYTSDNGFFHGEHRVRQGKVRLYEESIRVPLLMRGPGLPKGKNRTQPVGNIDLAPTIADFANAKPERRIDGRTLVPLAEDKLFSPGRPIGLEAFFAGDADDDPEAPPTNYQAVRTDRYVYAEYGTGEQELYDLFTDPFQLTSRHADPSLAAVKGALDRLLARTANCAGTGCAARPALKLKLSFDNGGGCVSGGIVAQADRRRRRRGRARRASTPAAARRATTAPGGSSGKIGSKKLSGTRKNRISVNATMLDGRVATVKAAAPSAC